MEAILGADTVGNSADINRVDHFVLHGFTMGQDRTFVQNFLQLSLLRGDRFLHLGYRFRCGLAKNEVVGTIREKELDHDEVRGGDRHRMENRFLVLHGHTMGQESSFVQNFLQLSSTFFRPGFRQLGTTSATCKFHANQPGGGGDTPPFF